MFALSNMVNLLADKLASLGGWGLAFAGVLLGLFSDFRVFFWHDALLIHVGLRRVIASP
jgi:hypothetical protein